MLNTTLPNPRLPPSVWNSVYWYHFQLHIHQLLVTVSTGTLSSCWFVAQVYILLCAMTINWPGPIGWHYFNYATQTIVWPHRKAITGAGLVLCGIKWYKFNTTQPLKTFSIIHNTNSNISLLLLNWQLILLTTCTPDCYIHVFW